VDLTTPGWGQKGGGAGVVKRGGGWAEKGSRVDLQLLVLWSGLCRGGAATKDLRANSCPGLIYCSTMPGIAAACCCFTALRCTNQTNS